MKALPVLGAISAAALAILIATIYTIPELADFHSNAILKLGEKPSFVPVTKGLYKMQIYWHMTPFHAEVSFAVISRHLETWKVHICLSLPHASDLECIVSWHHGAMLPAWPLTAFPGERNAAENRIQDGLGVFLWHPLLPVSRISLHRNSPWISGTWHAEPGPIPDQ